VNIYAKRACGGLPFAPLIGTSKPFGLIVNHADGTGQNIHSSNASNGSGDDGIPFAKPYALKMGDFVKMG
jgi:hypothetical protein